MPGTARATTSEAMTTFQPVETHANQNLNGNGNGNGSVVKSLVDHVEQIKESLKNVMVETLACSVERFQVGHGIVIPLGGVRLIECDRSRVGGNNGTINHL
jgi:hypothetical protein